VRAGFWLPKLADQIAEAKSFLLLIGPEGIGPWQEIKYFTAFDRHAALPCVAKRLGFTFADSQTDAIRKALSCKVLVITLAADRERSPKSSE
jgi:hypothetical protein